MSDFPTHAMILAAGLGTRMRPLTERIPKPLIEVAGRTLIDRVLDQLQEGGVGEAVVNVSYKAQMIEAHLKKRRSPHIVFSPEDTPLETGGGISRALPLLGDGPFFSLNADVVVLSGGTHFLRRMWDLWQKEEMDALLLVHPVKYATGYQGPGDFFLKDGKLVRDRAQAKSPYVFTGVQLLHPRLFKDIPPGAFSMNMLYERLMRVGRLFGITHDGRWLHVGDPGGLTAAQAVLSEM